MEDQHPALIVRDVLLHGPKDPHIVVNAGQRNLALLHFPSLTRTSDTKGRLPSKSQQAEDRRCVEDRLALYSKRLNQSGRTLVTIRTRIEFLFPHQAARRSPSIRSKVGAVTIAALPGPPVIPRSSRYRGAGWGWLESGPRGTRRRFDVVRAYRCGSRRLCDDHSCSRGSRRALSDR